MAWKAIACSAIGTSHQKQLLPCQDYGSCKILKDVMIGAVADGAGSAKYADVGAKLAVDTVLGYLAEEWLDQRQHFWQLTAQTLCESAARELFAETVKEVVSALQAQALCGGYYLKDLACTLLIVVATPDWVAAMQIGDGFITVRCQSEEPQLLFQPDKGEYINETTFITSANAIDAMRVCVRLGRQEFICAATDGLERVAIRMSDWTPYVPFFKPLEAYLREISNPEQEGEHLMKFLDSDKLNAHTDDDKTLLLCCYDNHHTV